MCDTTKIRADILLLCITCSFVFPSLFSWITSQSKSIVSELCRSYLFNYKLFSTANFFFWSKEPLLLKWSVSWDIIKSRIEPLVNLLWRLWNTCIWFALPATYNWVPQHAGSQASGYLVDLLAYLHSTFLTFSSLPVSWYSIWSHEWHRGGGGGG